MLTTIRSKLLLILLSFVLVTISVSFIAFRSFEQSKDALSQITQQAESTHVLLLKDIKITHEFFENESINPAFFKFGKSELIDSHKRMCGVIDASLNRLYMAQQKNNFGLNRSIQALKRDFSSYKRNTDNIIRLVLIRGFKDYGVEGRMRTYAHQLEDYQEEIGLVTILQLRRHEKDFIIRQEDPYIAKHDNLVAVTKEQLLSDKKIHPDKKVRILEALDNYSKEFNTLVRYEKRLGLKSSAGLKQQVDRFSSSMEASLSDLVEFSAHQEQQSLEAIKLVYLIIALAFLVVGIISALVISKKVSRSVTHLKEKIDEFVKSDFTKRTVLPITDSVNEVDVLATNFSIMEQHIVNQMNSLRQSNKDLEMLFYATSNNIRFPLLKAKELTDEALTSTDDPRSKNYLLQISRSWEGLFSIVDELGIITNVRSKEIETAAVDLEVLIRSVFHEFRGFPGFDGIIFSLTLKSKNKFVSSPGLLKAIFRNLVENSIKYATKRSSFSFLKIVISDQNEDMLRVELSDNGIGIKKEHLDRIFDMFYRGTTYTNGTGLGLYIVKCSLEKLDGSISVESSEDKGTVFTLMIPNSYKEKNIRERIIHNQEISKLTANVSLNIL